MDNKIFFDVDNVHLIKEQSDSQFALLGMDVFASGDNRHHLYVPEETLMDAEQSILRKPIVWILDPRSNDIGSHSEYEAPCGFVPDDSKIEYKKLPDGRTMMSITALVWKKYSGALLDFFRRDHGIKPVSVEIDVIQQGEGNQILSFVYDAITVLGSKITPAIPNAQATVLQFASEYRDAYKKEFGSGRYNDIDLSIPKEVKANVEKGLEIYGKTKMGGTSVALAIARFISGHDIVSPEKVRAMFKHLKSRTTDDMNKDSDVDWNLYGGDSGLGWSKKLVEALDEADEKYAKATHFHKEDEEQEMKDFAKEDLGKGDYSLKVNKSKDSLSNASWGSVDKTALRNKILEAKNYASLVHDVYMDVLSGWEDSPSSKLKYPVMQLKGDTLVYNRGALSSALGYAKKNDEGNVISKINAIYKHLGLDGEKMAEFAEPDYLPYEINEGERINNSMKKTKEMEAPVEEEKVEAAAPAEEEKVEAAAPAEEEKVEAAAPAEEEKVEAAAPEAKDDEKEEAKEEAKEAKEEEKEKMSLDQNLDMVALLAFLKAETESYGAVADDAEEDVKQSYAMIKSCYDEASKPQEEMSMGMLMNNMFAYCGKMAAKIAKMAQDKDVYMAENKELKAFKQSVEEQKMQYAVEEVLKEAFDAKMPRERIDELRVEASKFSMDTLDTFKNMVKAEAFEYIKKFGKIDADKIRRIALPYPTTNGVSGLWDKK